MKNAFKIISLVITVLCSVTSGAKNLDVAVAVITKQRIPEVISFGGAALPRSSTYDELRRDEKMSPAYLVIRIKDSSGSIAGGELEVTIDKYKTVIPVGAVLNGQQHDYFIPLSIGFHRSHGDAPKIETKWKRLSFGK